MRTNKTGQKGMTLIEVLVAILVLGTAVALLLSLSSIHTSNTIAMQDRMLARISAENALVDVMIRESQGTRVTEGGTIVQGVRTYAWTPGRVPAPYEGLDFLTIRVRLDGKDQVLSELTTLRLQERVQ